MWFMRRMDLTSYLCVNNSIAADEAGSQDSDIVMYVSI